MKEYLYNFRMAFKRNVISKGLLLALELTVLHIKKFLIRDRAPKKTRILGSIINFFDYGTLTGLFEEIFIQRQYFFTAKTASPVIFDCGGNIGMATLYFKKLYPKAEITVFEPDPATFDLLKKTIADNGLLDVRAVNSAVAGKNGSITFYSSDGNPGSLHMSAIRQRVSGGRGARVRAEKLSAYLRGKVDLIKMDIEGAEAGVLAELEKSGKIKKAAELAVEAHQNMPGTGDMISKVTSLLARTGFKYQVFAQPQFPMEPGAFQDVLIRAKR